MRVYGYLRASTKEQNAERAKEQLSEFAESHGIKVSAWFIENESGATLKRPQLLRLIDIAEAGDILLVEQIDRISRLNEEDWETLKDIINEKAIKIVSPDLATSHQFLMKSNNPHDEFTERMFAAINNMMLDMLAAVARKDYEDRRRRQAQGVQRAKLQGKYKGGVENLVLHRKIESLLLDGKSYGYIENLIGCSRHTISKVKKRLPKS